MPAVLYGASGSVGAAEGGPEGVHLKIAVRQKNSDNGFRRKKVCAKIRLPAVLYGASGSVGAAEGGPEGVHLKIAVRQKNSDNGFRRKKVCAKIRPRKAVTSEDVCCCII